MPNNPTLVFLAMFSFMFGFLTPAFSHDEGAADVTFTLQLLHAADMEGGVEALENASRFSSVLNALKAEVADTVIIGAGDSYLPGPFFIAGNDPSLRDVLGREGSGRADILMLNAMGFMASAFGNHEFDAGTSALASLIQDDGRGYVGTAFPFLSANLDFSTDSNLAGLVVSPRQEARTIPNSITKSVVITTASGGKVAVVGMTTPRLRMLASPGDVGIAPADPGDIAALAAIVQEAVDALTAEGINKIILTGHLQQIRLDEAMAPMLRDVDIIIAGGSNTLLADATDRMLDGDIAEKTYPILTHSATNEPIAIVSTDGAYRYVGRLVAEFDGAGILMPDSIDAAVSGVFATDEQGVVDTGNAAPAPRVVEITEAIRNIVVVKDGNLFGQTSVYLNGSRRSIRMEETNMGSLTAAADLAAARRADPGVVASFKNGGGIRGSIGVRAYGATLPPPANPLVGKAAGQISQMDIENVLRFNDDLSLLTLTALQLLEVVEHAVAASEPGATAGQFTQVAGLAFSFDLAQPPGARVQSLVITDADGNPTDVVAQAGKIIGSPKRTFRIVTLNFLADGGDGYPYPNFPNIGRVELPTLLTEELSGGKATFAGPGTEQDALAEYLAANFSETPFAVADVGPESDERIQNLAFRADSLSGLAPTPSTFDVELSAGLNMVSLPLMPAEPYTARAFMEKIGATAVIAYDTQFVGFTANSAGDGFAIEGGKGYIVNVTEAKSVSFTGNRWENALAASSDATRAAERVNAHVARGPVPRDSSAWAFILHAQLEGITGVTLTVYNSHGEVVSESVGGSHAVWADMNRQAVVSAGDTLTIEVRDASDDVIRTLQHRVTAMDIRRAFTELRLTPAALKPTQTGLFANYPNPFNPETWLPYQLANGTDVIIHIYAANGQLVRRLEFGFQRAGYYVGKSRAAYWDGKNELGEPMASGVYFCQLITPEFTTTRKMGIVK